MPRHPRRTRKDLPTECKAPAAEPSPVPFVHRRQHFWPSCPEKQLYNVGVSGAFTFPPISRDLVNSFHSSVNGTNSSFTIEETPHPGRIGITSDGFLLLNNEVVGQGRELIRNLRDFLTAFLDSNDHLNSR